MSETLSPNTNLSWRQFAWIIWLVAAIFYSYEFFLRISPTVITEELTRDFNASKEAVGFVSGMYYYAYAIMQIPVGLLLDRFGPRRLLTAAAAIVSLGCLLFAITDQLWVAGVGRALMGIGSAFAFVGCLKLSAAWFPASQFAMVVGLTNTLGVMGAIFGEEPLAYVIDMAGWRHVMLVAMLTGIGLTILNYVVIRDYPYYQRIAKHPPKLPKPSALWQHLKNIIQSKQTWLVAIYGGLLVAPISGFSELWCVPFLMKAYGLTKAHAAGLASVVFIGIAIGGPVNGALSNLLKRRRPVMLIGAIGACLSLSILIYMPLPSDILIGPLFFLFGFFSSNMLLCFALNSEIHPKQIGGTVVAFTNMLVMLGGTIFQPLLGYFLDQDALQQPHHLLTLQNYQHAFIWLPICQLIGVGLIYFIRETYCCCCDEDEIKDK
jgi:MFS family permease